MATLAGLGHKVAAGTSAVVHADLAAPVKAVGRLGSWADRKAEKANAKIKATRELRKLAKEAKASDLAVISPDAILDHLKEMNVNVDFSQLREVLASVVPAEEVTSS